MTETELLQAILERLETSEALLVQVSSFLGGLITAVIVAITARF